MLKETQAAWPAVIDEDTYNRVQTLLRANHRRKKPESETRYPYQLTGLVFCASCGERMVGKSAHGNSGKIGYYEHGWSRRKRACLGIKPTSDCRPFRLQAKKLEPAVWEIVSNYLKSPKAAEALIRTAEALHKEKSRSSEARKTRDRVRSLEDQLEDLSERLAELPKTVSPAPVFKQMEKIESLKVAEQARLSALQGLEGGNDAPVPLKDYQALLGALQTLANAPGDSTRGKVLRTLVHRIEITPGGFRLHFHVGRNYVEGELARAAGSPPSQRRRMPNATPSEATCPITHPPVFSAAEFRSQ